MKTGEQLMAEAKARIKEVSPQEVLDRQRRGDALTFLDVRDLHEVSAAKIPGTIHVSRGNLETKIDFITNLMLEDVGRFFSCSVIFN